MYLSHYNLKLEPFSISTDPQFLWLGEKHKEALAALKYGILANKGFLLLTGDVGTGKTTLIHALLNILGDEIFAAKLHDPGLEKLDFLNQIASAFRLKKTFKSKGEFISYFSLFLRSAHAKNKKVLLIIDEAQRLNDELLEEIRLLSNIEKQYTKLINIFFVGQNEFNEILIKNENRALRQRITLIHTLETLNPEETAEYIQFRLKVAGSTVRLFKPEAAAEVYSFSDGYPRLINIICDRALLTGFVRGKTVIDARIIRECAQELRAPIKSYGGEPGGPQLPAAGRNSQETVQARTPQLTIRTLFLLMLLLTLAAFYFQNGTDLSGYIHRFQNRFGGAAMATKTQNAPPAIHLENMAVTYRIPIEQNPVPQKVAIVPPSVSSLSEKEKPALVEDDSVNERIAQATDAREIRATEPTVKSDAVISMYFDYNSQELSDDALSALDRVATVLKQNPDLGILIKGYTDNSGKFSYNLKLSQLRAAAVKAHLVEKGINSSKLEIVGLGPDLAGDGGVGPEKNRRNRRVEIEFK